MNQIDSIEELGRLRNRHVAKLLSLLGTTPPYLEIAIKKAFSMFAEDVQSNIINSDNSGEKQNESERSHYRE